MLLENQSLRSSMYEIYLNAKQQLKEYIGQNIHDSILNDDRVYIVLYLIRCSNLD